MSVPIENAGASFTTYGVSELQKVPFGLVGAQRLCRAAETVQIPANPSKSLQIPQRLCKSLQIPVQIPANPIETVQIPANPPLKGSVNLKGHILPHHVSW
jgi:hypothetical protein